MFILMKTINSCSDFKGLFYFFYRFCSASPFSGTYTTLSLPFLLSLSFSGMYTPFFTVFSQHPVFGHVYCPFFTVFARPPHFRARILPFLYRFCSATTFSGTYTTALSLPFLLGLYILGHVYSSFFTVFPLTPRFRARILPFLYRFCSATPFSGTYTALSLPFLLGCPVFGHDTAFFTIKGQRY